MAKPFHGIDDPWYKHRFEGVELWGQPGGTAYPEPPLDRPLESGTPLPFPDADLFCFDGTPQLEAALLIQDASGILVTCDAVQHYGDYSHNNFMARLAMPFIGFPKTTVLGPFWLKMMTPAGGSLRGEFHRLLELKFDALIAAHGTYLPARGLAFVLTGSSARTLRRRGVNLLTGRALTYRMHPLTAVEQQEAFNLRDSVQLGHLPARFSESDPAKYLKDYVQTYLREEVMQESLLIAVRLPVFSREAKRRLISQEKFYVFGAGVFRAIRPVGPLDSDAEIDGPALETLVLQELRAVNDYHDYGYQITVLPVEHTFRNLHQILGNGE